MLVDKAMSLLGDLTAHFDRLRLDIVREPMGGSFIKYPYLARCSKSEELQDWESYFMSLHFSKLLENGSHQYLRAWVHNFISAYRELGYAPATLNPQQPEQDAESARLLKPFLAQAVHLASQGDYDWIKESYDEIHKIVTRREETNFDASRGLFFWESANESGVGNNPALSNEEELKGAYLACDLNAYQYEEYLALSEVAWAVGNAADAAKFAAQSSNLKKAIQKHLWNEELGTFDNRRKDTGCFVNCITFTNFVPLWAKLGTAEQAQSMFEQYLLNGDHLMTPWGGRTVSRQDRAYHNAPTVDGSANWSGPVWPLANYFYFQGLIKYDFKAEAKKLAERMGRALLDDLNTAEGMHENYSAETGRPLGPCSNHQSGGIVGSNLLLQNMLIELDVFEKEAPDFARPSTVTPGASGPTRVEAFIPKNVGGVSLDAINDAFLPKKKKPDRY